MRFSLTPKQEMIRQVVREFAANEVTPLAAEIDQSCQFPSVNVAKMAELNLLGIPYPEELFGAGGDNLSYVIAVEELSRACATTGVICSAHTSLACFPIYAYGTKGQQQEFLVPLLKGEKLGAFALTEANAGTDAAAQQTTAILDGDEYIINGSKLFITNAGHADIFIVMAMTDLNKGTEGISAFIMEKGTPGFGLGKLEDKLGIRASDTRELILENCRIPRKNLLGREGQGFKIALVTLDGGRIGIAAQAVGIAQRALDESLQYVDERKQFGSSIGKFQAIQFMLAEMATKIEAARLLTYRAAETKDQGQPFSKEAAMAKYYASEVAMDVTVKAIQLHGGYGYTKEYPVERLFRDAKITEIYEGTTEVQKMVIASKIMK